jgi:double-stranded uracil-DNA glycosylase
MSRVESFPPIASERSRVLILGSMPGAASLKAGQYYALPRNAFWRIMGELFEAGPHLPYDERVQRLDHAGVALWDSLQSCVRPGSLDAAITDGEPNDFAAFFAKYPRVKHIYFNGAKAETIFCQRVLPALPNDQHARLRLPSTSPAHASMAFEDKLLAWRVVRDVLS